MYVPISRNTPNYSLEKKPGDYLSIKSGYEDNPFTCGFLFNDANKYIKNRNERESLCKDGGDQEGG